MKPGGGAALYDAIYLACTRRDLVKGEPYEPRRVIIVVGDGHDNASKHTLEEVLELAQRNLVTIYAVSTMAFGFSNEAQDVLERLTHKTGGHVEYPLNSLYKDVSGYLSNPSDDGNYALDGGHRRLRGARSPTASSRRWAASAARSPRSTSCATGRTSIPRPSRRCTARSPWIFRGCPT